MPRSLPAFLLRAEGFALFAAAVVLYVDGPYSLWPLFAFALAPDFSIAAYLVGPRAGAIGYDAAHTSLGPLVLGAAGVVAGSGLAVQVALVWAAHIGADRLLGYGLKYPTAFRDTHLQRV